MAFRTQVFPSTIHLYYNDGFDDSIKFHLGSSKSQPLYTASLETDFLQRPKLTLLPAHNNKNTKNQSRSTVTPLASVKSKGLKDSVIVIPPPQGGAAAGYPEIREKLHTHYGLESRTFFFTAPVDSARRSEQFMWRKRKTDAWGLKEERELVRVDGGHEVVAVWRQKDGTSASKTGSLKFTGSGASGQLGPRWEIMAVASILRVWHEDYHVAKTLADALGGGA